MFQITIWMSSKHGIIQSVCLSNYRKSLNQRERQERKINF